ncbi:hypothetical protein H4R18_001738 [Coemansia javaensis]|uniref:Uncharacterized protein n=1 Tax=Coemansia javaensis TaxID=2761396 RepID=A0A9W8LK63_9FUNG|nr:hypothetical protein H4R18_001738 [Coemansia javaensis]
MLAADHPLPAGVPFEPYGTNHALAIRYTQRLLVDDVAGESVPRDAPAGSVVCVSDLPPPVRVLRPGMQWPRGLALPSDALVVVVDADSIIRFVGRAEDGDGSMAAAAAASAAAAGVRRMRKAA